MKAMHIGAIAVPFNHVFMLVNFVIMGVLVDHLTAMCVLFVY